jgi:hypothetical protein
MQVRRMLPSILLCGFLTSALFAEGQDPKAIREVFFFGAGHCFYNSSICYKAGLHQQRATL